jgi:tetratricopeptide (TPR) repeat protein
VPIGHDPGPRTPDKPHPLREPYVLLLMAFVSLGVYYPSILSDFCTMDDIKALVRMLNFSSVDFPRLLGFGDSGFYRRPLGSLFFYATYLLAGDQALLYHLENVLFHLGNGIVVYYLVKRALATRSSPSWPALVAGFLFLLHPLNVEAVAWTSGGCAVMSTFFVLLATYYHLSLPPPGTGRRLWVAAGCYLLSLLSYEQAAAMPFAFAGWDLLQQKDLGWREAIRKSYRRWIPYGVMLSVYIVYWGIAQWTGSTASQIPGVVPLPLRLGAEFFEALVTKPIIGLGFYLKKMVLPWPLNFHISAVPTVPYFLLGFGFLVLLFIGFRRRQQWTSWGWAFVCSLLPVVSLTVYGHSWTSLAERYAYLAGAFFTSYVGLLCGSALRSRPRWHSYALQVLSFAVLAIFGFSTTSRALVWQDDKRLLADTYEKSPDDGWVAYSYALVLNNSGRTQEAEVYLKRAYDLGYITESALLLGRLEESRGNYKSAERYYLKAAWPSSNVRKMTRSFAPDVYQALAQLHWRWGKVEPERVGYHHERAVHFFERAYEFSRHDPMILYNMGKFYLDQGNVPKAQECFREVHARVPETYYGKAAGKLMVAQGRRPGRTPGFETVIRDLQRLQ